MAKGMSDAWAALEGKVSVPSELRTTEWQRVPQWIRERQFYMAGVHRAEILEEFRSMVAGQAAGKVGEDTAIKNIQQFLDGVGYQPEPGQEGTIKDLRSVRRILVSLRTNQRLLQGYGQKMKGLDPAVLRAYPAWELIRSGSAKVPRNWLKRFTDVGGEPINGRIIALKTDLVWAELGDPGNFKDAIGVDYPPLAWGSHMRWKGVPFKECKELGILDGWTPPDSRPPLVSPNESLQMKPRVKDPEIRAALDKHLEGLAEWRDEALVFTDPNGTRPIAPVDLAELWKKNFPPQIELFQKAALDEWLAAPEAFDRKPSPSSTPGRLDAFDDLLRLFNRLTPMADDVPVFRDLVFTAESEAKAFLLLLASESIYQVATTAPAEIWAASKASMKTNDFVVTLISNPTINAKDLRPLGGGIVFTAGRRFKVEKIIEGEGKSNGATVYLKEVPDA